MPQLSPNLEHRAAFSGRLHFTKDTSASQENQVLIHYILMAQCQGRCWYCFPSKRQKRNSSRKVGAQLAKVYKIFSFQDSVEVTRLGSGGLFDLKLLGVHLVRHRFAPIRRKLSWCPWWISLECLLYARHYIQLMRLPMRMFLRNPCKHNP